MIDSGAGETFTDQNYAKNFKTKLLDQPIISKDVDGTINKKGTIKSYICGLKSAQRISWNNFMSLD